MAGSITRLVSQIKTLQAKADDLAEERARVVSQTHDLMAELDRAVADIRSSAAGSKAPGGVKGRRGRRGGIRKGTKVPPKYRGPSGETWSGRGLMPIWLRDLVKKGKKAQDFLIKKGRG